MIRKTLRDDLRVAGLETYATFRGITAVDDEGAVKGVTGVMYSNPPQCISWISEELRQDKRVIVKAINQLRDLLNQFTISVYAVSDPNEETAQNFIKHVGFKQTDREGVFIWPIQ